MLRIGGSRRRRESGRARAAARSQWRLVAGLVVAAARWRRGSSVVVLLAATTAVGAAVLGPLWATAAQDSLATDQVRSATVAERQLVTQVQANVASGGIVTVPVVALRDAEAGLDVGGPAGAALTPPRLLLATTGRLLVSSESEATGAAHLAWTDSACGRLPLRSGGCAGEQTVLVSDRTARSLQVGVGDVVDVPELGAERERPGSGEPFPQRLTVTGVYETGSPEQEHFAQTDLFSTGPAREVDGEVLPAQLDAVLVDRVLVEALFEIAVTGSARRSLVPEQRTAPELTAVADDLRVHLGELRANAGEVRVDDDALALLDDLSQQGSSARQIALLLGAQLLLLACCVLGLVVSGSADARAPEVALGRLRGLRWPALAAFCAAEPLLLVLLAVPLGCLAGAGTAAALAAATLPGPVALRPDAALSAALGAAVLAAVVAVVLGVRSVLARGVLTGDRGGSAGRLVADVVLVTLAGAALWQVVRDRSASGTGLLAPLLAALAGGVLLARLGGLAARVLVRRDRGRSGVARFLALRRTARVPGGVRTVVLVAAAVSITTYAAAVLAVTDEQRSAQAAMEVGAASVYRVASVEVQDLVDGVARADPSGRRLMATATAARPDRSDDVRLLGVDSERFAAVAGWRSEWSSTPPSRLARALQPETAPVLELTGSAIVVDLRSELVTPQRGSVLRLSLITSRGAAVEVPVGEVRRGDQRLTARTTSCDDGCRLAGLVLRRPPTGRGGLIGTIRLRGIAVDGRPLSVTGSDGWRAAPVDPADPLSVPSVRLEDGPDSLGIVFAQPASVDAVGVQRADVPAALPLLLAGRSSARLVGRDGLVAVSVPGPRSGALLAQVADRGTVLPRLGDRGFLADLVLMDRASPLDVRSSTQEVWSAGPADAATEAALEAHGLEVLDVTSQAQTEQALRRRGSAEVLSLLPVVAALSLGLAVLGLVAHALAHARPRAVEAAALHAVGVPRAALGRAAVEESGALLALGALAGALSGGVTAVLTAAQLGSSGLLGVVAPFPDSPPWLAIVLTVALATGVLGLVTAGCAATGLRPGDGRLLRQETA